MAQKGMQTGYVCVQESIYSLCQGVGASALSTLRFHGQRLWSWVAACTHMHAYACAHTCARPHGSSSWEQNLWCAEGAMCQVVCDGSRSPQRALLPLWGMHLSVAE